MADPARRAEIAGRGWALVDGAGRERVADALLAAYDDEALWNRLVDGGLTNTEREFSPERARQTLRAVFASLR